MKGTEVGLVQGLPCSCNGHTEYKVSITISDYGYKIVTLIWWTCTFCGKKYLRNKESEFKQIITV